MRWLPSVVLLCAMAWPVSAAASDPDPIMTALRADAQRYQKNLVAAAQTMPAEKYGQKPTSEQMGFGQLMAHVAHSNILLCAAIGGQNAPSSAELSSTAGKAEVVGALEASFRFCGTALAAARDSTLGDEVPFFGGRRVTRATAVLALVADWGDHYSLAATELRLAGLLPPTAQRPPTVR